MPYALPSLCLLSLASAFQAEPPTAPAHGSTGARQEPRAATAVGPARFALRWEREVGGGFSRPVVAGDRALVVARRERAELTALRLADGEVEWRVALDDEPRGGQEEMGGRAPHADPLVVGDLVIVMGFGGGVGAYALVDGALRWRLDLVEALGAKPVQFGFAATPVLVGDTVVLSAGAPGPGYVAVEPATGAVRWRSAPYAASYVTPILATLGGASHLVCVTGDETAGLDPATGVERWRVPHVAGGLTNFAPLHLCADGGVCVSGQGTRGLRRIDVEATEGGWSASARWLARRAQLQHGRVVAQAGRVFGATSAQLVCVDEATGELGFALRAFAPCTLTALGRRALLLEEDGDLALVQLAPERVDVFARVALGGERAWSAPVVVDALALVRTGPRLVALGLPALGPDSAPVEQVPTGGAPADAEEPAPPPLDSPAFPWSAEERARLLGAWSLEGGGAVEFLDVDGALRARAEAYPGVTFAVIPESRTRAWARALDAPYGIDPARLEVPSDPGAGSPTIHLGGVAYPLSRRDR